MIDVAMVGSPMAGVWPGLPVRGGAAEAGRHRAVHRWWARCGWAAMAGGGLAMSMPLQAMGYIDSQDGEAKLVATSPASRAPTKPTRSLRAVRVVAAQQSATQQAQTRLSEVPGGVSVVDQAQVLKATVVTAADVLAYQPGVYAQAAGGNDGIKISVRGSSINRGTGYFRSGILILFDGLPVTGPGGTPYELFEPLGLNHTEILRGANGFDEGSLSLGGTINYLTESGFSAAPLSLRLEAGSYGYSKQQMASGGHNQAWDYYLSVTHAQRDGYQDLNQGHSSGLVANLGYRFNPWLQTRLYVRWRQTFNGEPGNLTWRQIQDHPRQANPLNAAWAASRLQPGSSWLGSKTTFRLSSIAQLELGWVWHRYPIDSAANIYTRDIWHFSDISFSLNYRQQGRLFGLNQLLRIGILSTRNLSSSETSTVRVPVGPSAGLPIGSAVRRSTYGGADHSLHLSENLEVWPNLHLLAGISGLNSVRRTAVVEPFVDQPYHRTRLAWAPRFGFSYDFASGVQLYGNLSRSVQTPDSWAILAPPPAFSHGPATGQAIRGIDLRNQRAETLELGARGDTGFGYFSVDLYHSAIRHELLAVQLQPPTASQIEVDTEYNASATTHQGLEAGLRSVLGEAEGHRWIWTHAYTYSDFHYDHDPRFGHRRLPGLPRHFCQAQLRYEFSGGVYLAASSQLSSRMAADYANSRYAAGYAIFGLEGGYQQPSGAWSGYVDIHNLSNRHYAPIVVPGYDDHGQDAARYQPGEGVAVYVGLSYHL